MLWLMLSLHLLFFDFFFLLEIIFYLLVCVSMSVAVRTREENLQESVFSAMQFPGMNLRSSGMVVSAFNNWAISPVLFSLFEN